MVDGDGACAEEDQREGKRGSSERKLISRTIGSSDQSIVQMYFPDGHSQIDENEERGSTGEESHQDQQSAEKFGEGGNIAQPCRQSETGNHLCMVMQTSKNFVIAVCDHNGAQG